MNAAAPAGGSTGFQKALLAIFEDCMKKEGWTVSGPGPKVPQPPTTSNVPPGSSVPGDIFAATAAPAAKESDAPDRDQKRAAECAYARQAAPYSSRAKAIAAACEIECKDRLKASPDAPRPAACPPK